MEFTTGLMSLDTALNEMLSRVTPLTAQETLPLVQCFGRILASDVVSPLDVPGFDDEACQSAHNAQPALVVVHGVLQAAPFPAFADLTVGVKITQTVCTDFFSHGLHLPESS